MRGVLAGFDGVLLGGESEGVPTHGVKDVKAVHLFVAADDVGGGVALGVADVESRAAGVREHVENVVLRLGGIEVGIARIRGAVGLFGGPMVLPLFFKDVERVGLLAFVGHVVGRNQRPETRDQTFMQ